MADPPTKRARRCQRAAARGGKRALAPDSASPPNKRSRKRANVEAEQLLASGGSVRDVHVLQILRSWKFSDNAGRANVTPDGMASVSSDTLGLVSSRTGMVFASRLTKRYPAVFELLSAWVRQAWPLTPPFPFTSVNVNYGYAARMHRDSNNVGPSLTKAFGPFHGGSLKYWGSDEGSLSLEELRQFSATVLDTGRALCLFDGRRAHSVEPFSGERYSLVYFSSSSFSRAGEDVLAFLFRLGAHIPTSASLQRAIRYLAPPRGYDIGRQQQSMRQVCGMEAMPTCVTWTTPTLCDLESHCLDKCLSFVISPALMSCLCAVSKPISAAAHRKSSWCGTIVDASGRHPAGNAAMTHFKSWSHARAVIGGSWERGSLSFLVDGTWVAWAFVHWRGANMLVSRIPVPSADVLMMFCANGALRGKILVGIATNTSCQDEITSSLRGRTSPRGAVAVAAVLSNAPAKAFRRNGLAFGPRAEPIKHELRGIVQFSVCDRRTVAIAVPGRRVISAMMPADIPESVSCHCFVALPPAVRPDEVTPCWSRRSQ